MTYGLASVVKTFLPLLLVWTGTERYEFSPTAISAFLECQRKWAWRKIGGIEGPSGKGADLGKRTHAVLEKYLGTGERPDFITDALAAKVASSGLHLLPAPKTPGMQLERHFRFMSARTRFIYHGFKDVQIVPGVPVPGMGFDGTMPIVIDHKTTKKIDEYAKTAEDLQDNDPQSILYGLDSMARFASDAVDLGWGYLQTEGQSRAQPTTTRLHADQALRVFDVIEDVAAEAARALDAGLQPLDLPPNPDACNGFGGCPYRHLCNLSPSQRARSHMSNSMIADLRARVQGKSATITEQPPAPLVMSDRDVPAPKEIPAAFLATPPGAINPPESALPPPSMPSPTESKEASADTGKRKRRTKAEMEAARAAEKDPTGADAHLHTGKPDAHVENLEPEDKAAAASVAPDEKPAQVDPVEDAKSQEKIDKVVEEATRVRRIEAPPAVEGFTLYVDCIPIGKPAKAAARLIEKAQDRMLEVHGVPDYRLIDFGKGVPFFISFVDEQVDGTFDLALDTRTPEGAVLLETLMAKAAFVVRGLR